MRDSWLEGAIVVCCADAIASFCGLITERHLLANVEKTVVEVSQLPHSSADTPWLRCPEASSLAEVRKPPP